MVFFTSILIVFILYYLQTDGLIYVIIVAVIAELMNIFMTQTLTKSVEKKAATKFEKIAAGYKAKIATQKKTIKEFETIQEKSVRKLNKANLKIKDYEEKFGSVVSQTSQPNNSLAGETKIPQKTEAPKEERSDEPIDLPSGSNKEEQAYKNSTV